MARRRWVSPQEYAITRRVQDRRRQEAVDAEARFQEQVVGPMVGGPHGADPFGLADQANDLQRTMQIVGWHRPAPPSVKGTDHLCILCEPKRPAGFGPVQRLQLAATCPCTRCGVKLETVDPEKK